MRGPEPWITYEMRGSLLGEPIASEGGYLAWPRRRLRSGSDVGASVRFRRPSFRVVEVSDGDCTLRAISSGIGATAIVRGEQRVASIGLAYGPFEVSDDLAARESSVLAHLVASGAYRLVQRGRLVDEALLDLGSPMSKRAAK